jgi:hypothetical protein
MGSKFFYGMFAFTLAFLLGLIGYWAVNKQYVSKSEGYYHGCPKYKQFNRNTINRDPIIYKR